MPPDQQALSSGSLLSALVGGGSSAAPTMSGLTFLRSPGKQFIGILQSRTAQDDLITQFHLLQKYHCKFYADCRHALSAKTIIAENDNSGMISITVIDRDRYLARDITQGYLDELNKLVNTLSTSSARREREFLEQRLQTIKIDLHNSSVTLSEFSSRNATINPQLQGQQLLESATHLQSDLISAEAQLSGLKTQFSDDNVQVRQQKARIAELQAQLKKMGNPGNAAENNGTDLTKGQVYPTIRELPLLGVTYTDLSRQAAMQENIYETLTKQYELAKVEESKEIPPIKVLDAPEIAEVKTLPHRSIIVLLWTLAGAALGVVWVILRRMRNQIA
jgi:capsule polysaccharide export protein KpsE/RkpR